MLIGYMRVSSDNDRQSTDLQRDALVAAGVDMRHLFEDRASGAKDDRSGLAKALDFVQPGDVLVVWKLDRLGRSLSHLLHTQYNEYSTVGGDLQVVERRARALVAGSPAGVAVEHAVPQCGPAGHLRVGLLILNSAFAMCCANPEVVPPICLMKGKTSFLTNCSASAPVRCVHCDQRYSSRGCPSLSTNKE